MNPASCEEMLVQKTSGKIIDESHQSIFVKYAHILKFEQVQEASLPPKALPDLERLIVYSSSDENILPFYEDILV